MDILICQSWLCGMLACPPSPPSPLSSMLLRSSRRSFKSQIDFQPSLALLPQIGTWDCPWPPYKPPSSSHCVPIGTTHTLRRQASQPDGEPSLRSNISTHLVTEIPHALAQR